MRRAARSNSSRRAGERVSVPLVGAVRAWLETVPRCLKKRTRPLSLEAGLTPSERCTLMIFADFEQQGGATYPSLGRVAGAAGVSKTQMVTIVQNLRELGLLTTVRPATQRLTNGFRVTLPVPSVQVGLHPEVLPAFKSLPPAFKSDVPSVQVGLKQTYERKRTYEGALATEGPGARRKCRNCKTAYPCADCTTARRLALEADAPMLPAEAEIAKTA